MSRPLDFVPEDYKNWPDSYGQEIAVLEITIRTVLGMFLLKPKLQNCSLIVGIMEDVQRPLKFDIYGDARLGSRALLERASRTG
jgi:hypothetical protein